MSSAKVVSFGNQKGGIGKSTLCVTFANYLVAKGKSVRLMDCDVQRTVYDVRIQDLKKYPDMHPKYDVHCLDLNKTELLHSLLQNIKANDTSDVVLFDLPPTVEVPGINTVLANSDFIVIPYSYIRDEALSTTKFLAHLRKLRELSGGIMKAHLFLVQNRFRIQFGTAEERKVWGIVREAFMEMGDICPAIKDRADMTRYSTVVDFDKQSEIVAGTYDYIISKMFANG